MRPRDLKDAIMYSLEAGSGNEELGSIYVEGPPGVGKSELVQSVVDDYNDRYGEMSAGLMDYRLTLNDPTDLRGMPYPDFENKLADWFPPKNLPNAASHPPKGILFFDDLTTAPQMVQAAAFQLVIKPHKLDSYQLPEGWIIVGAGNRTKDKSAANKMPKALANRFYQVEYEYNVDDWMEWALEHKIDTRIIAFLKSPASYTTENHLLMNFDPEKEDKAFATPRSWTRVSRTLRSNLSPTITKDLIEGSVGKAASGTFYSFMRLVDEVPDPKLILEDGNMDITLSSPDAMYAMIVGLANGIKNVKHMNNAIGWALNLERDEYSFLLLKIVNRKGENQQLLLESDKFTEMVKKFKEINAGL